MADKTETKAPAAEAQKPPTEAPQGSPPTVPPTGGAVAIYDPGEDAGAGMENVGADEQIIPFFRMVQSNSPEIKPGDAKFIDGVKQSDILNKGTGQFYDALYTQARPLTGVETLFCYRDRYFAEFTPRDAGGGFHGIHPSDDPRILKLQREQKAEFKKIKLDPADATSNEFIDTFVLYSILVERDEGGAVIGLSRGIFSFASTQIKKYKGLIGRVDNMTYPGAGGKPVKPPLWAHRWRVQTVPESNKSGSFYGWRITLFEEPQVRSRLDVADPLYQAGREFYNLIKTGKVKGDYAGEAAASAAAAPAADSMDDEIPF